MTLFTGNCLTRAIYFAAGLFHGAPLFFHSLLPIVGNLLARLRSRLLPNLVSGKKSSNLRRSSQPAKLRCSCLRRRLCPGAWPLSQGCCVHPPTQWFGTGGGHVSCLHLLGRSCSLHPRARSARPAQLCPRPWGFLTMLWTVMGSLNLFPPPPTHPGQPQLTHMGFWDPALTPLPQQRARCPGLDQGLVQPQQHHGATGGGCHPTCHCSRPQGKRSGAEVGCGSLPGSDRRFPPGSARLPQLCPVVGWVL